jgi:hypothetical protein
VSDAISDSALQRTLARFAAVAGIVLDDPAVWLGHGGSPSPALPGRSGQRIRRLVTGSRHPGSRGWSELPVDERVTWWVRRIQAIAAPIAATPRVFGLLADRVPLQGAFGATAAGLAVCAVAREHGVRDRAAWVPLLGRVLFDRDLSRPSAAQVVAPAAESHGPPRPGVPPHAPPRTGLLRRGAGALWWLARVLWDAESLFDDRPRGAWAWRAVGKVPVVGVAGGILDERGAVARAARETSRLIEAADRGG